MISIISEQPLQKKTKSSVCAVIVTYNRLDLLKACIEALKSQTRPPDILLVVDNGSTDETSAYLQNEKNLGNADLRIISQPNKGSSDGFASGLQAAFATSASWFWCMDDDTIPDPTCLACMLDGIARTEFANPAVKIGWLNSVIRWSDGSLHLMNEPALTSFLSWGNRLLQNRMIPARWCSYVSLLVSRAAVEACGVPLRKMFIWYDDVEYTTRIVQGGFTGWVVLDSLAEHRTAANYCPDLKDLSAATIGRFKYAFRNSVVTLRRQTSGHALKFCWCFSRMLGHRIALLGKLNKWRYLGIAISASIKGLFFDMRPEPISAASRETSTQLKKIDHQTAVALL